jgi:predicted nuclease of restriction endonuclease-like (RecB) superfamily
MIIKPTKYADFIKDIKNRIQKSQIKAALSVNKELISLYWDIAAQIVETQKNAKWGDGFLQTMSDDLSESFPDMKGFSLRNLKYMRQWYLFWGNLIDKFSNKSIGQQVVAQLTSIPWGHNLVIISKIKNPNEAIFYLQNTIEYNWSRAVLYHQIEYGQYERQGKAITNFKTKLPKPQSDLALQIIKDPYNFDFLNIRTKHDEKELEKNLTQHMSRFLLELGNGFSFIASQYKLSVGDEDFYVDLLFYHTRLHCYVAVELKAVPFKPEFTGKLGFYAAAIDDKLKTPMDNSTIGILICKSKNKTVVEYALQGVKTPIGVSDYQIIKNLPKKFKSSLPSIEDIEKELNKRK